MTQRAALTGEQRIGRRVVQVHAERVREQKLHMTERVLRPWSLAEQQSFHLAFVIPVDRLGVDGLSALLPLAQDLDVVPLEERRIAQQRRHRLTFSDAVGYVPV